MYKCPYCQKWFKDSLIYHRCKHLSVENQRPKFKDSPQHETSEKLGVYSEKLSLGFDMLQDDYED